MNFDSELAFRRHTTEVLQVDLMVYLNITIKGHAPQVCDSRTLGGPRTGEAPGGVHLGQALGVVKPEGGTTPPRARASVYFTPR